MHHTSSDDESKLVVSLDQGVMIQQLNLLFRGRPTVTPHEVFVFYQEHLVPDMFNLSGHRRNYDAVVEDYNAEEEEFELYGGGPDYQFIEHLTRQNVSQMLTRVINSPRRRRQGSREAFARLNRMPGAPIRGVPSLQLLARSALPTSQQAHVNSILFPPPARLSPPNVKDGTGRRRKTKSCRKKSCRRKYRK
jgi:hypothetical protein